MTILLPYPDRFMGYQCYNGFYDNIKFHDRYEKAYTFENQHRTEVTTDLAIEELKTLSQKDKPFMLMMSYQAPHYPEQPAPKYEAMYKNRKIIHRQNSKNIDPFTPTYSPQSPRPFEKDPDYQRYGNNLDEYIRLYNAMCTQLDDNVGRLVVELEKLGIADNTMIVYTSDHGDMQGSHGLKNKNLPHEESAGIPLIVYLPNGANNQISDAMVSGIDLMPTCLEVAGAKIPKSVEGKSFAKILTGEKQTVQDAVFLESYARKWRMIVKGNWKLAIKIEDVKGEIITPYFLTNVKDDPYEMNNLIHTKANLEIQNALLEELKEFHNSHPWEFTNKLW